jgi:hypothetical protein
VAGFSGFLLQNLMLPLSFSWADALFFGIICGFDSIPSKFILNFDAKSFERTTGIAPFVFTQRGEMIDITSVRVSKQRTNNGPSYRLDLTLSNGRRKNATAGGRSLLY